MVCTFDNGGAQVRYQSFCRWSRLHVDMQRGPPPGA